MKKSLWIILFISIFTPCALAMGYKEASTQKKPIVLYFYSPTCGYCKEFNPIYNAVA